MSDIDGFIKKLESFRSGFGDFVDKTVDNNEEYLIDGVLQKRLFNNGQTGAGASLPEYAFKTVRDKIRLNKRYQNMTLNHTGSWYDKMYITSQRGVITADSLDDKTETLTLRYGEEILEFQEVEQKVFVEDVLDPIIQAEIDRLFSGIIMIKVT